MLCTIAAILAILWRLGLVSSYTMGETVKETSHELALS
jgi:hypothetical protein